MNNIPPDDQLKNINQYGSLDQLQILKDICNKIYIARNISMNDATIHDMLSRIDKLFKDRNNFN